MSDSNPGKIEQISIVIIDSDGISRSVMADLRGKSDEYRSSYALAVTKVLEAAREIENLNK